MVIVRNDSNNTFDHVARTLARVVPGVSLDAGYRIADTIPQLGPGGLVGTPRAGRALLGAAQGRRPDDGAAGAALNGTTRPTPATSLYQEGSSGLL